MIKNSWLDTNGKRIQAHGGCIQRFDGIYYWYGENKDGPNQSGPMQRVDVIGVSCYTSADLITWENCGLVLSVVGDDTQHDLTPSGVLERPKVLYNPKTKQYVMWAHIDKADYSFARVGVAISDTPLGPFRYIGSFRPHGLESRDFTLFEDNGTAYIVFSSDHNRCLVVSELTKDYLGVCGRYVKLFQEREFNASREAPVVLKHNNLFYMITSGCTGWKANPAEYAAAGNMLGEWEVIGNPCVGRGRNTTFGGQGVFAFKGKDNEWILILDVWNEMSLRNSGYMFLNIEFNGEKMLVQKESKLLRENADL